MTDRPLHESARRALEQARAEAARLGHEVVGSEHLLLGVLRTSPLASEVIGALGLENSHVLQKLETGPRKVRPRGDEASPDGELPLSSHARRLLEGGRAGGAEEVNDVALLLAAVGDARGTFGKILAERGVGVDVARNEILRRAGLPVEPAAAAPERTRAARPEKAPPAERAPKAESSRPERKEPKAARGDGRPERQDAPKRSEARSEPRREARREPEAERPAERTPSLGKLAPKPKTPIWRWVLLLAVPASITLNFMHASETLIFVLACVAILPLASLMGEATEHIAVRTGPTIGGLLNATFGNAAELIIAIIGLRAAVAAATAAEAQTFIDIVKASVTGSILGNLLLILGLVFLAGGLGRPIIKFNRTNAGMSAGMLFLAVVGLVLPAIFHWLHRADTDLAATERTLSLEMSVVLILTYAASLWFSLRTHSRLLGGEPHPTEGPTWSMGKAIAVLGVATAGVAYESEILVHALGSVTREWGLSPLFLGLIIVPIVGNAAEHAAAVVFAKKGQMDLALQIALGSSTQIALLVAPLLVFAGALMGVRMDLVFQPFEVVALALATLTAAVLMLDGETHWFEGVQLLALYAMVGIAAFFI
jgi:Ca2+:H+ antiporter